MGFNELDSFTGGFKDDDLIVLGIRDIKRNERILLNVIRNIADQNKKVLYVNYEEDSLLQLDLKDIDGCVIEENRRYPKRTVPNIKELAGICQNHQDIDIIVIYYFDFRNWRDICSIRRENPFYQLKSLAHIINIPIIATFLMDKGDWHEYNRKDIKQYFKIKFKNSLDYIDYLLYFYPSDPDCMAFDLTYELEAWAIDVKKDRDKTVYMYNSDGVNTITESSERIRKLLQKALSLGLDKNDAISYALYWEDKEINEFEYV